MAAITLAKAAKHVGNSLALVLRQSRTISASTFSVGQARAVGRASSISSENGSPERYLKPQTIFGAQFIGSAESKVVGSL